MGVDVLMATTPVYDPSSGTWVTHAPAAAPGINYNQPTAPSPLPAPAAATTPAPTQMQTIQATNAATIAAQTAANAAKGPMFDKATMPSNPPAGQHYAWIGGASTGQWQLYANTTGSGANATGGGNPVVAPRTPPATDPAAAAAAAATAASNAQIAAQTAQNQQNAITFLTTTFTNYGLGGDIAAAITQLVQQGYTADTIQLMAQDPKSTNPLAVAFQQRFPANAARLAAGLPVLSPGEYIATEQSYAQVLQSYGLPASFAANQDVFAKLLTNDISPTELNTRVSTAKQVVDNTDPLVSQQLQQYYGINQGQMIAQVLDPSIATPIIQKEMTAAQIGAESTRAGVNVNLGYAEQLGGMGVTQSQAQSGFQSIAQQQPGVQALASRYTGYGSAGQVGSALQAATFGTTGAAQSEQELTRLKTQEMASFTGSSGVAKGSLMGSEEGIS